MLRTTSYANIQKSQNVLSETTRPGLDIRSFVQLDPIGCLECTTCKMCLGEPLAINKLPHGQRPLQFVYNCTGHRVDDDNPAALLHIGSTLQKFPPNAMYLMQAAEVFIIRRLKRVARGVGRVQVETH